MLNFYHVVSCCVGAVYLIVLMMDDCKDKMILTRYEYMVEEIRGEKVIKEVPCPIVANVFTHVLLEIKRDCLCCYCPLSSLFVVCCLLFVVCCLLFVGCWLLFVLCSFLVVGCGLLFVGCCLFFVLCWLLVVGCCLLVLVCWLLFVICSVLCVVCSCC